MPKLIAALMRHGEYQQLAHTPSAHQPFPLSSEGRAHARAGARTLLEVLGNNRWTLLQTIDSSRMQRAWQSARIIADCLQDEVAGDWLLEEFDGLAERGLGSAANLTVAQIEEILHQDPRYANPPQGWKGDSHYCLPMQGAESLLAAGKRVAAHLNERMAALSGNTDTDVVKLFVGHGAAFRHAAFQLGVLEFDQLARLSMHHCGPVFLEYRSEFDWRHIAGEWKPRVLRNEYND